MENTDKRRYGPGRVHLPRWKCLCDCGNTIVTKTNYLTSGKITSCGHAKIEDRTPPQKLAPGIKRIGEKNKLPRYRTEVNVDGDTKFVGVYPTYFEAVAVQDAYLRAFGIKHRVLKKEQDEINLREKYDEKCVNGVAMQLFKGKEGRKDVARRAFPASYRHVISA